MKKIRSKFRNILRGVYRVTNGLIGFAYDFRRFRAYGGWREDLSDVEMRNYNIMMAYHGLEKSLSYKNRNPNSGWSNAERVFARLKVADKDGTAGHHDKAAKAVLTAFLGLPVNREKVRSVEMLSELIKMDIDTPEDQGILEVSADYLRKANLEKPEDFFLTRHSMREYSDRVVPDEVVMRAMRLAMKTPSVCNRHAWHVYHSSQREVIDLVLKYQNGNHPFGRKVPCLLIVTVDLKAFFSGAEHYQHWIDGGLFSMSLIYAFHALGLATCPLNWCQDPKSDRIFRKAVQIRPNHTIIMMIAVGYPDKTNYVCSSSRRPLEKIYSKIQAR